LVSSFWVKSVYYTHLIFTVTMVTVITLKSTTWNNIHLTYLALEEGNGLVGTDLFQFRTPKKTGQMAAKGKLQFN